MDKQDAHQRTTLRETHAKALCQTRQAILGCCTCGGLVVDARWVGGGFIVVWWQFGGGRVAV